MRENSTHNPTREQVAATIKAELAGQGMTQADLAAAVGITRPNLNRTLQAQHAMTLETFFAVAEALGLTPDELMRMATERAQREARRH